MNKEDMLILSKLAELIRQEGSITKGMLYKNSNLSMWKFKEIKQYLPDLFEDIIYDRKKQRYTSQLSLSFFTKEAEK